MSAGEPAASPDFSSSCNNARGPLCDDSGYGPQPHPKMHKNPRLVERARYRVLWKLSLAFLSLTLWQNWTYVDVRVRGPNQA